MTDGLSRRGLLGVVGAGSIALAGCVGSPGSPDGPDSDPDRPEGCPTTRDLGVEWPDEIIRESVEAFVEAYENAYYREVVVEYEPESRVDAYGLEAGVTDGPREVDGGYELAVSGSGGVYRPTLHLGAVVAESPGGVEVVSIEAVEDDTLRDVLLEAAENGEAEHHVEPPGEAVDSYIESVASLSAEFEPLSSPGDSDTAYFAVEDTTVELTVQADRFHGDYWWKARYYVDEYVLWRAEGEDSDPKDGELLECREPE
jgi:hypothetical protein